MPRPYSNDLRWRVVDAVLKKGLSRHQAAARFGVAVSTAINWVDRVEKTGDVAPDQIGGYRLRKIRGEHEIWLQARIQERDFTLRGLVAELGERGLKIDYFAVWTFVHEHGLTHKKRHWSPASKAVRTSRGAAANG
jgi:putative transposase